MKLAVDTHHLLIEHAGTKRVTDNIIEQLQNMPDIDLVQLSPRYQLLRGTSIAGKLLSHFLRFFWVHIHLPLLCYRKKIDALLSPEFNTPIYAPCLTAVIVHDAHMRAQQQYTSSLWFYFYYIPFIEFAIRRADVIFTVSEFAKRQIVELMRLDEHKVHVVYNGIDKRFIDIKSKDVVSEKLLNYGLDYKKYILFVGTFESRKNIERLLEAFAMIKGKNKLEAEDIKIAVVGKPASKIFSDRSKQIESLINSLDLKNDVILTGFVPDDELPLIYQGACVIAFPSLHEGFGLPIVEGFASMVPVLTSNICAMPEIAGGAALLVDPYDVQDIADKMKKILFITDVQKTLVKAGTEKARLFTWKSSVEQIVVILTNKFENEVSNMES